MDQTNLEEYRMPARKRVNIIIQHGISFGSALAIVISFSVNHSVLWAIIHGLFSWLYVLYYCLFS